MMKCPYCGKKVMDMITHLKRGTKCGQDHANALRDDLNKLLGNFSDPTKTYETVFKEIK